MTDTVILAIVAGLPPTLVALGGLVVSIRNGKKSEVAIAQNDRIEETTDKIHEKANTAIRQNEKIAVQTDGNLAGLRDQLAALTKTTELQERTIQQLTQTVDKLAAQVKAQERQVRASDKRERYDDPERGGKGAKGKS